MSDLMLLETVNMLIAIKSHNLITIRFEIIFMILYSHLACKHNQLTNLNHSKLTRTLEMCSVALFHFTGFEPTVASFGAIIYYIVTSHV